MTREEKIERLIASEIDQMDFMDTQHHPSVCPCSADAEMYMCVWESISKDIENDTDEQIDEMYNYHLEGNDEEATA